NRSPRPVTAPLSVTSVVKHHLSNLWGHPRVRQEQQLPSTASAAQPAPAGPSRLRPAQPVRHPSTRFPVPEVEVDFRFTPEELEVHRYARTSARTRLPLSRLSDPAADVAAWAAFSADGWTQACLGEDAPDDLPFLAGLAREVGAVAGAEAFVHNGW